VATIYHEHAGYLADGVKRDRYHMALARSVRPGASVLDLGCGSGVLGLMALRLGACRVHFVDETAAIELARRAVRDAGFQDRAVFHRVNSFNFVLPERVDVVVCDHIGYFGLDYGAASLLADAQRRFLRAGGQLIPSALHLHVAAVCEPTVRDEIERWRDGRVPADYAWVATAAAQLKYVKALAPESLLSASAPFATVRLGVDDPPFLSGAAELHCERDAMLDGVGGWFHCTLVDGVTMTNAPDAPERLNRPNIVLPLERPVPIRRGERIRATVMLRPAEHLFAWRVELPDQGLQFDHSTWNAQLLDGEDLARASTNRPAALNARGALHQRVLEYCDGKRTVGEIVAHMTREHPALMPSAVAMEAAVLRILGSDTVL